MYHNEMVTFMGLTILVCPLFFHLTWSKCVGEAVGDGRTYTLPLWGKQITRSCPGGQRFSDTSCGCVTMPETPTPEAILHGKRSDIRRVPWALSIVARCHLFTKFVCSAVLIRDTWALSAVHCRETECWWPPWMWVYGGEAELGKTQYKLDHNMWASIKQFHYDEDRYGDIMLLQLDRPMPISETLKPIHMVLPGPKYVGKTCTMVGFGAQGETRDGYLYQADVRVLPRQNCSLKWWRLADWTICVNNIATKSQMCKGDSGGGLLCKNAKGQERILGIGSEFQCDGDPDLIWQSMYASVPGFQAYAKGIIDGAGR